MTKYSTFLVLGFSLLSAQWVAAEDELFLGAALQVEPSIYKDGKDQVKFSGFRLDREGFYLPTLRSMSTVPRLTVPISVQA